MDRLNWLAVVRHGQSTGNVIADRAERDGAETIEILQRDADVPLSGTGREQAEALTGWVAEQRPGLAVISPYRRARETAEIALRGSGVPSVVDERLRDRELGVLDLLTGRGVDARYPGEAARRRRLGKFYYRPPGGESWADVLLRLRALLRELSEDHPDGRIVLFGHEATAFLVRYLAEGLAEAELMAVAHRTAMANASVSSWRRVGGRLTAEVFNHVEHLHRQGARPTHQEDVHGSGV